jgi:hypothetical protein
VITVDFEAVGKDHEVVGLDGVVTYAVVPVVEDLRNPLMTGLPRKGMAHGPALAESGDLSGNPYMRRVAFWMSFNRRWPTRKID